MLKHLDSGQRQSTAFSLPQTALALFFLFFISGFTALLYQVVWQRMLGLFSGSDIRAITLVVAAYLLGLGLGGLLGGALGDRLSRAKAVQLYGFCNLGIAAFAIASRFVFYDFLFRHFAPLAQSVAWTGLIAFGSLLIPTALMGMSLPLLAKAISPNAQQAALPIGLLYGINTLGSGIGTLLGGWYIIGTLGYELTVYLGALLNAVVGVFALKLATTVQATTVPREPLHDRTPALQTPSGGEGVVRQWSIFVFLSGFSAISLEIIWFRVLDTVLQSIAYTYAHLLAFILIGNALGSILGARTVQRIRHPRQAFLCIQGIVAAYSAIAIGSLSLYWQAHPIDLRSDIGYIDLNHVAPTLLLKYIALPFALMAVPNVLLGFSVPLVQQAVQTQDRQIGQRVGVIQIANILGNTIGSLATGLLFLDTLGTAGSLRLIVLFGLGFVLLSLPFSRRFMQPSGIATGCLIAVLATTAVVFPNNARLWAALHGIPPQQYFLTAEDATGVAGVVEANGEGTLLASGQAQANFPYLRVHALLGSLPALMHPAPKNVMIIGLGSGGTAHTIGINPLTESVQVVELLGAELDVLRQYAHRPIGKPLRALFQDPRYQFIVGDGRRELTLSHQKFDLIETDAIYPWRSRAGLLYSQEFFQEVQAHLAAGGMFVEWNSGVGVAQTLRNVFPYVTQLSLGHDLYVLIGSDHAVEFNRSLLLSKLRSVAATNFLKQANVDVAPLLQDVESAGVTMYSHLHDGQPKPMITDLFPRSEYYLNQSFSP
ncbi:MAG TPA: fused MFS/spermidine synthase [Stenomitos sp.]